VISLRVCLSFPHKRFLGVLQALRFRVFFSGTSLAGINKGSRKGGEFEENIRGEKRELAGVVSLSLTVTKEGDVHE
jgi:hypothetical protein